MDTPGIDDLLYNSEKKRIKKLGSNGYAGFSPKLPAIYPEGGMFDGTHLFYKQIAFFSVNQSSHSR
ncbi:hypothetical protein J15TS10_29510 [Paenibacillus woosongensis]|uniref:Uncharacterized protein n=1 Tax=Paenibacillus woosongensis TaxID=307580 RepID=A0ABQ4MT85_9BACL|nr:hypothetical protein J15TS10_29510 [Paenibacillus woosongensis]